MGTYGVTWTVATVSGTSVDTTRVYSTFTVLNRVSSHEITSAIAHRWPDASTDPSTFNAPAGLAKTPDPFPVPLTVGDQIGGSVTWGYTSQFTYGGRFSHTDPYPRKWTTNFNHHVALSILSVTHVGKIYTITLDALQRDAAGETAAASIDVEINGVVTSEAANAVLAVDADTVTPDSVIRFRAVHSMGTLGPWHTLELEPVAVPSATILEGIATLDGSGSYDLSHSLTNYSWVIADSGGDFYTSSTNATSSLVVDLTSYETSRSWDNDELLIVKLIVTDSTGHVSDQSTFNVNYQSPDAGQFGLISDPNGPIFSAIKSGSDVKLYRFNTGAASREEIATVSAAKNPTLRMDGAALFLKAEANSGGDIVERVSNDFGRVLT